MQKLPVNATCSLTAPIVVKVPNFLKQISNCKQCSHGVLSLLQPSHHVDDQAEDSETKHACIVQRIRSPHSRAQNPKDLSAHGQCCVLCHCKKQQSAISSAAQNQMTVTMLLCSIAILCKADAITSATASNVWLERKTGNSAWCHFTIPQVSAVEYATVGL